MRTRDTSRRPLSVVRHTRVLYPNVIVKLYIGQIAPSFCSFEPRRLYTFKWIPSAEALNKRGLRKNRNFQPIGIFCYILKTVRNIIYQFLWNIIFLKSQLTDRSVSIPLNWLLNDGTRWVQFCRRTLNSDQIRQRKT